MLKEYFDRWKNATDKNKILRNMKNQKQLQTIKNIDESKNNNDLKNILINGNIIKLNHIQNRKIFPRRSPKKYKNKSTNKKNKEQKLLKDAFNKWKQNSTFLPTRNVLQQIKKNKIIIWII